MPDERDDELPRRFVQGDRDAFEALFRQFEIEVFHWILRIVRDASTAEDVSAVIALRPNLTVFSMNREQDGLPLQIPPHGHDRQFVESASCPDTGSRCFRSSAISGSLVPPMHKKFRGARASQQRSVPWLSSRAHPAVSR